MNIDLEDDMLLRYWIYTLISSLLLISASAYIFTRRVYDEFIWQYFWGPIVADAHGEREIARSNGETIFDVSSVDSSIIAEPGYTIISTLSYALILIFGIIGIILVIKRFEYTLSLETAIAFTPFMMFGGFLRTVEDLNVVFYSNSGEFLIPFPISSLIISPLIYFVLFIFGILVLVISEYLEHNNYIRNSNLAIGGVGIVLSLICLIWFGYLGSTTDMISVNLRVPIITLFLATVVSIVIYYPTKKYTDFTAGVKSAGLFLMWAHMVDAFANVLSLDWTRSLGIQGTYESKHVFNSLIRTITDTLQPEWVSEAIGITWPFIVAKITIVVFLYWALEEEFFDESPNLAVMLLITAMAVGLGPGTRDFTRAMLGI